MASDKPMGSNGGAIDLKSSWEIVANMIPKFVPFIVRYFLQCYLHKIETPLYILCTLFANEYEESMVFTNVTIESV
jgi:hypothetical protein